MTDHPRWPSWLCRVAVPCLFTLLLATTVARAAEGYQAVKSPNGRLELRFWVDAQGVPRYRTYLGGREILAESRMGLVREDEDFSRGLALVSTSPIERVQDKYELLTSKRRLHTYVGQRRVFHLQTASGRKLQIIVQVSDDGVAFRYSFPERSEQTHRLVSEASSFRFLAGTRAYLQPIAVAKSGWAETNPSYEETYETDIVVGTPSPSGVGWAYPALFRSGNVWLLVSETGLGRTYAGTHLQTVWRSPEYTVAFPSPLEGTRGGPVNPESKLPWLTPWRLIVIGDLATIIESSLGTDLADKPAAGAKTPADAPGKASWSWPLLKDEKTELQTQKRFVDYAAEMRWRYTLVDALWERQIGYDKLKELVDYARGKGVRILVWHNSAGDWNSAPYTPKDQMLTHESRVREFTRLKEIGVAGLKVDFFAGDGQSTIAYYHDILEDAAAYGFVMNFHGATIPRGWHRTFPHLMTMEAVRGLESVTFDQRSAEHEPTHATILPFTRNVFDPMDFTPVVLDRIDGIERRTSSAFELALSVLFTSGIQHYAEIPEGMAKAPDYVRDFLKQVPNIWEDVRFLAGEPGRYVVLARRAAGRWYIAGINGEKSERTLTLSLARVALPASLTVISDGDGGNLSFRQQKVALEGKKQLEIKLRPRGGFVAF